MPSVAVLGGGLAGLAAAAALSSSGFEVDLYVSVDLRSMTAIWMGLDTVRAAVASQRMVLTGSKQLASSMQTWLGLSPFAKERKLAS